MRLVSFAPHTDGTADGDVSRMKGGIIYPGSPCKSHEHPDWHLTVIVSGVAIIRGKTGTFRVSAGDAVEVLAHESHEIEAINGPVEYRCVGNKGF